jgi:cation:H+ antiporter
MEEIWTVILFIAAFYLVAKGADLLISGTEMIARRLLISTILISLTVVALGNITPVLVVSIFSILRDRSEIAVGSIVGSNIIAPLLAIGFSSIIRPSKIRKDVAFREVPLNILASLVFLIIIGDIYLDYVPQSFILRSDGLLLLCFFILYMYYLIRMAYIQHEEREKKAEEDGKKSERKKEEKHNPLWRGALFSGIGFALLYLGGDWIVNGVQAVAELFGLSDFLISTTVVALGTSMPDIYTSIKASKVKETDIAIGDNIGSCILRIFLIFGIIPLIKPIPITEETIIDALFVLGASIMLLVFIFAGKRFEISRWKGIVMALGYLAYLVFVFIYR